MQQDEVRWWHLASCQNTPLNTYHDDYESDPFLASVADGICVNCPVRAICRREGEQNNEYGLWGGVFLVNGKVDPAKNSHKSQEVWDIVNDY